MAIPSAHTAGRRLHHAIAATMMVIYLLITLSPLSTLAMQSKRVAHAVTGECSGDCDICSCSVESRASHTCCCSNKRQQPSEMASLTEKGSTAASPAKPRVEKRDCCAGKKQHNRDEIDQHPSPTGKSPKTRTVLKCGCPCGNSKLLALWGSLNYEIIPCRNIGVIAPPAESRSRTDFPHRLTSRHCEPPDPPPRLSNIS